MVIRSVANVDRLINGRRTSSKRELLDLRRICATTDLEPSEFVTQAADLKTMYLIGLIDVSTNICISVPLIY